MSRLAAALAGLARQTGAPALEQLEDEGFVRFHNTLQRLRLVDRRSAQEPMPPAIGGGRMDAAAFGRLGEANAVDHRLRLVEPAILLAQPGHPRPGRGVEGAPACLAAIPRQAVRPTQPTISSAPQCAQPRRSTLRSPIVANASRSIRALRRSPSSVDDSPSGRASGDGRKPTSSDRPTIAPSSVSASAICSSLNRPILESQSANSPASIAYPSATASPTPRYQTSTANAIRARKHAEEQKSR